VRIAPAALVLALGIGVSSMRAQLITLPPEPPASDMQQEATAPQSLQGRAAFLLLHAEYDEIDRLADRARSQKSRAIGGAWKLRRIYGGLAVPSGSNPEDHITRLKLWIAARPQSITAHVALAGAYIKYAWVARGSGYADTVTPEGLRLFNARIAEARSTLEDSANFTPMCPQWFSEMQTVALAQGWDAKQTADLFAKAVKFEPEYFYFYESYANYLLPKWEGQPGDAAAFAKKSADAVGAQSGDQAGDFLYFEIAGVELQGKNADANVKPSELDWQRLQRGHDALVALYGRTNNDDNELALMAYRYRDIGVAKRQFAQIGEKWARSVWKTRASFDKARKWSDATDDPAAAGLQPAAGSSTPMP